MIKFANNKHTYYDKNGTEITEGCFIKFSDGKIKKVYLTENGFLGTDATNPLWIEKGKAVECECGIYPLTSEDTDTAEVVKQEAHNVRR